MLSGFTDRVNPVLEREARERMRNPRTPMLVFFYLALLTALLLLVYSGTRTSRVVGDPTDLARLGRSIFENTLFFELGLAFFLVPAFTAGAIAGERERETLKTMQVTLLSPRRIVLGKVAAACAFLFFLEILTAPLLTLGYVIGGVSVPQVALGLLSVLFVGFVVASVSVACSAAVNRVQSATVLTYTMVLLLLAAPFVVEGIWAATARHNAPAQVLLTEPLVLPSVLVGGRAAPASFSSSTVSALGALRVHVVDLNAGSRAGTVQQDTLTVDTVPQPVIAGRGGVVQAPRNRAQPAVPEEPSMTWFVVLALLAQCLLAAGAIALAARRVRTPAPTER